MDKINVLFIGGIFTDEIKDKIIMESKNGVQNAANEFQLKFLRSLESTGKIDLDIVSLPFVGHYPFGYKCKKFEYTHSGSFGYDVLEFNNIFGVKNFSRTFSLDNYIRKNNYLNTYDVIFVYSAHNPFLTSMKKLENHNKKSKLVFILPDLPQYMNSTKNLLFRLLKNADSFSIMKKLKKFENFVVLTDEMKNTLKVNSDQRFLRIEGIANDVNLTSKGKFQYADFRMSEKTLNLCYTGTLDERYGVKDLIDGFCNITNESYRLILCGAGDSEAYIVDKALSDSRIIYLGQIDSQIARQLQMNCDILVNPRKNDAEYTKYSFPSKIMEYLSTGKPVICYKLDGIPEEYDNVLTYLDGTRDISESLSEKISEISNLDEKDLENHSGKVMQFITNCKSEEATGKKILEFCERILK